MAHLFRVLVLFFISSSSYSSVIKDKLQFRLSNGFYTSYVITKELKDLKFFHCLSPKSIIFNKLVQHHNLGAKNKFKFTQNFFELKEESFFQKKDHELILHYLRMDKLAQSISLRIPYEERKKIEQVIETSSCKGLTQSPQKKVMKFKKIEQLLETRFNLKGLAESKQREVLLSFFNSLETQYYFEKFY